MLGLLIAALLTALAAAAAALVVVARRLYDGLMARAQDREQDLVRAHARIAHLELTLDELRARDLSTSLPALAATTPAQAPLPSEVRAELDEIEDPDHRAELAERARYLIETEPDADPAQIARELFI